MADDKTRQDPRDSSRIAIGEDYEWPIGPKGLAWLATAWPRRSAPSAIVRMPSNAIYGIDDRPGRGGGFAALRSAKSS